MYHMRDTQYASKCNQIQVCDSLLCPMKLIHTNESVRITNKYNTRRTHRHKSPRWRYIRNQKFRIVDKPNQFIVE